MSTTHGSINGTAADQFKGRSDLDLAYWVLQCFQGREDVVAVQNGKGFTHEACRLTKDRFAKQHLSGDTCLGFYVIREDDHVLASAPDLDNHNGEDPEWRTKTEAVYFELTKLGLSPVVEVSQSGEGSHVWLLFAEPVPAWLVRRFWRVIEAACGVDFREINPKQDSRHETEKGLGNLVRYPLRNKSRFVDVENDWQELDPIEALSETPRMTASEFRSLCSMFKVPSDPPGPKSKATDEPFSNSDELPPRVAELVANKNTLLGRRWHGDVEGLKDQSRSGLVHAIACGLVKRFVPTAEIATAIRVWGRQHGYENVERVDWIRTTLKNAYEFVAKNAQESMADGADPQVIEYERITCAQLDAAEYDLEYLIDGVLVARQPMIFAGGKKQLKTNTMVDMAIALATCGYWLGKFKVNRGCRVALMSGESGLATLQETARRICRAAGKRLSNIEGLVWSTTLPRFDSPPHLEALREFLKGDEIEVVMIDPAYMTMPGGDAGNLFVTGQMLRNINELCASCGATLIVAHHTKRSGITDTYAPAELEHISWAGFQEYCRQWVLLSRREKYEPGTGEHKLWLSLGGSAGHSSLWALDVSEGVRSEDTPRHWAAKLMPADDMRDAASKEREEVKRTKNEAKFKADKQALIRAMLKYPDGETKTVLRTAASMSGTRVDLVIDSLLEDGSAEIVEVTKPGRKTPREGYRLTRPTTAI